MAKNTEKPKDTDVAAIATEEGNAVVGGRPGAGTMYENLTAFDIPFSDESDWEPTPTARHPVPLPAPVGPVLPNANVARQVAAREIGRLRGEAAGIERQLARPAIGVTGVQLPHQIAAQAESRKALAEIRNEIDRLNAMDDHTVREWAFNRGVR